MSLPKLALSADFEDKDKDFDEADYSIDHQGFSRFAPHSQDYKGMKWKDILLRLIDARTKKRSTHSQMHARGVSTCISIPELLFLPAVTRTN